MAVVEQEVTAAQPQPRPRPIWQQWIILAASLLGAVLDGFHAHDSRDFCHVSGGRGLQNPPHSASQVQGCWEVHPVTAVEAAP